MAAIKSALEIALERTKDLKVDTKTLAANEARQEGKKMAAEFLANPADTDLAKRLAAITKEQREHVKEGVFEVLSARLQLPTSIGIDPDADLGPIATGLKALSNIPFGEKRIQDLFNQLVGFLKQYLEDAKKVDEAIRKQYAPRLKMKEQEMSARMGRPVRIDPMNDPDFAAFYKQNVGQMKIQYQDALDKAKSDLAALCGIKREK
jgi:hypothetical protein